MIEIVKQILRSNKIVLNFPYAKKAERPSYFGPGELSDLLSFGFSFVEHEDHCVEYILVSPTMAKRIIQEIEEITLTIETNYLGFLWTAHVILTDKINDDRIIFANKDYSVVLDLNTRTTQEICLGSV
jgi:hypothetical protein